MKVIMIYDQIQSGAGIKDDHMIPLGAKFLYPGYSSAEPA